MNVPLLDGSIPTVSAFALLAIAAVGLVVLSALRLLRVFLTRWPMPPDRRERWLRTEPMVEAGVWLVYLAGAIGWFLQDHPLLRLGAIVALVVLLVVALWFVVRDYLGGLVMRAEGGLRVGDRVRMGELDGVVRELGVRSLVLELSHGQRVVLGYRAVREAVVVRESAERLAAGTSFRVDVPEGQTVAEAWPRVRRAVLLQPWVPPAAEPRLKRVGDGIEVTLEVLGDGRDADVEAAVRRA